MVCPRFQIPNSKFSFRGARKGFTLIELLIYSVIFVVAGGLVTGITLNIKKNTALNEAQRTVDTAFNDLERRLSSAIENSVAVNSVSGGDISLASAESETDNAFSLSGNDVYYRAGTDSPSAITGADVKIDVLNFRLTPPQSVNIDPINHWAYNDIFGWIDFGQTGNSIKIPTGAGDLTGVAWGKGAGYVFLNCLSTDNCLVSNYKVSADKDGNLSGYAWSESMGWISFCGNTGGTNGCATSTIAYGVTINTNTGVFTGQAWSEVAGYISFNCITGGSSGTNVCSTSNYKVQDLRRKTTAVTVDIKISYNVAPYQSTFRSGSVTFNLKQPSKVKVYSISPSSGTGNISSGVTVSALPSDPYFKSGAIFKLVRSGYKDVYPSTVSYTNSTTLTAESLDLTGVSTGVWDVMVINPDGQIGVLTNAFTVYIPAAPPVAGQLVITPSNSTHVPGTVTTLSAPFTSTTNITSCEYTTNGSTWLTATVSGTAPSFTCTKSSITSLVDGTSYIFNVRATNSGGTTATTSLARIGDTVNPTNPTLTAIPDTTQVSLSWTVASDTGSGLNATTPYKVVFATGATAPVDCSSGTQIYLSIGTSYIHTGLTNGTQYSYRVCAIDGVSNMSAGNTASAIPYQTYTVTIQPATGDTNICEDSATVNYGSVNYLGVGKYNATASENRVLISFDFSANVPTGAHIVTATLSIYSDTPTAGRTLSCCRLLRTDWVETQATWNLYKNNYNWGTAGAKNSSTDYTTTNKVDITSGSSAGYVPWVVTSQVQTALDSVSGVAHFLIFDTTPTSSVMNWFLSSQYSDTAKRPKLYIEYTY